MHEFTPTVGRQVLRTLARHAHRTAFICGGRELSYAAIADLIGRMQAVLVQAGARRGQGVALLGGNRADIWCASVAAQCCGMRITWLHPLGALDAQREHLEDSGVDYFIVDADRFIARGAELTAAWGGACLSLGPTDYATDLLAAADAGGATSAKDLALPADIATVTYTGGTTGKAKGALRRHSAVTTASLVMLSEFEFPTIPRYLAIGPISHVTGTKILPTLLRGGTITLLTGFDPDQVCAAIARDRINTAVLVPTMIYKLLDSGSLAKADTSSLELLLYGASAMSPARLEEGIDRLGPVFGQLYGQTECYPIAYMPRRDHDPAHPERFAACGFPTIATDVRLLDDDGNEVPQGEPGEICVRGPLVMEAYWDEPELTRSTLRDGWLHTDDVARSDDEGRLYIVDRKKDMIVSGGFNVYPREIEDIITAMPDVALAAVVGAPDPKWGETVVAVIVRRPGAAITADAVIAHVKARRGAIHAPKRVDFVDALPQTAVGKVDKKVLRAGLWEGQARMVG